MGAFDITFKILQISLITLPYELYLQSNIFFDPCSIISPNLKSTVYCHAIAAGDEKEWNFAWEQYLASNVGSEKNRLLSAMGCTKHTWILSRCVRYISTCLIRGHPTC